MVFLSLRLCCSRLQIPRYKFIDALRIYVRGGSGGNGLPKYRGIGGDGGSVYIVGDKNQTLKNLKQTHSSQRFIAGVGGNSRVHGIQGDPGEDLEIPVQLGITVSNEYGKLLGEINEHEEKIQIAIGGMGGNVDTHYNGLKGEGKIIILDLKLIADVGFVGFPNAGKSTLLKAVSRANPEISAYPFTTIRPQIGIIEFKDLRQISLADLPGLVEGAHINIGMGHRFLKHVERTKLLLMIVDVDGFRLTFEHEFRKAFETIILLNKELELYKKELLDKPCILVINKMDTTEAQDNLNQILDHILNMEESVEKLPSEFKPERLIKFDDIIPISAKTGFNVDRLIKKIRELLDHYDDILREGQIFEPIETIKESFKTKFV